MYDTVITPHATAIMHPNHAPRSMQISSGLSRLFNTPLPEIQKLSEGQIAIPVQIETGRSIVTDPTLANYETPIFLSKNQKKIPKLPRIHLLSASLMAANAQDSKNIRNKVSAAAGYKQKLSACKLFL